MFRYLRDHFHIGIASEPLRSLLRKKSPIPQPCMVLFRRKSLVLGLSNPVSPPLLSSMTQSRTPYLTLRPLFLLVQMKINSGNYKVGKLLYYVLCSGKLPREWTTRSILRCTKHKRWNWQSYDQCTASNDPDVAYSTDQHHRHEFGHHRFKYRET